MGQAGLFGVSGEDDTQFAVGGGGYRWRVGPAFVLRVETRYRRWFQEQYSPLYSRDINDFSLLVGLGAVLGGG